jgi:glycosyltransferase involved in cell wall biosynthesis
VILNRPFQIAGIVPEQDGKPGTARPARLLFVSPVGERGGAETVLLTLVRGLDRTRFEPIVVFLKDGPFVREVASAGVEAVVLPTRRVRYLHETLRTVWTIRRLIQDRQVALVFGNMAMGHLYGGLAALATGAKAVWFQHGVVERPDVASRLALSIPAVCVYVNSMATLDAHRRLNRRDQVKRIVLGVDFSRFDPDRIPFGQFRKELGIPARALLLLQVGHFWPGKGHDVVLKAFSTVAARITDAWLILVGGEPPGRGGRHTEEIRQLISRMGLSDHAILAGNRDDMPQVFRDADLLVHGAVTPEGFGLVLAEAMAMGVPVVASRIGGTGEVVADEVTGFLVPPGDADALAERIFEMVSDCSRRIAMGKEGRRRAQELFSAPRMISQFEESFERVLANGS